MIRHKYTTQRMQGWNPSLLLLCFKCQCMTTQSLCVIIIVNHAAFCVISEQCLHDIAHCTIDQEIYGIRNFMCCENVFHVNSNHSRHLYSAYAYHIYFHHFCYHQKFLVANRFTIFTCYGICKMHCNTTACHLMIFFSISYLKGLIPSFNECVDQFLENLMMKADGRTEVLVRKEFGKITLKILGKV